MFVTLHHCVRSFRAFVQHDQRQTVRNHHHHVPCFEGDLERRVVPASPQIIYLGHIKLIGDSNDLQTFVTMINNASKNPANSSSANQLFLSEYERIKSSYPIEIRLVPGFDHFDFGDTFTSKNVYIDDLKLLPTSVPARGAEDLTQGEAILHILEERWSEAKTNNHNRNDNHKYAQIIENKFRNDLGQPSINPSNSHGNTYHFSDGGSEHIHKNIFTGQWEIDVKQGMLYRKLNPPTSTLPPTSKKAAEVDGYEAMVNAYNFNENVVDTGDGFEAATYSQYPGYSGYLADLQTKAAVDSVFESVDAADWNRFWADMTGIQTMMTTWLQWNSSGRPGDPSIGNLRPDSLGPLLDAHVAFQAIDDALPADLPVTGYA